MMYRAMFCIIIDFKWLFVCVDTLHCLRTNLLDKALFYDIAYSPGVSNISPRPAQFTYLFLLGKEERISFRKNECDYSYSLLKPFSANVTMPFY